MCWVRCLRILGLSLYLTPRCLVLPLQGVPWPQGLVEDTVLGSWNMASTSALGWHYGSAAGSKGV